VKTILISLLCLFLIGISSYSYAQYTVVDSHTKVPEVMLQLELRDSNGGLIAYIESGQIIGISPLELNRFLDNQNQTSKEFLVIDDKKYESQQWEIKGDAYVSQLAYTGTRLLDIYQNEFVSLIVIRHDSFQSEPSDVIRVFWTIIRPVS